MIRDLLSSVNGRIEAACGRSGRAKSEVELILVTKTVPIEKIREAYELGVRDFGENRIQEWLEKKDSLPRDIRWHLIGHLQTNKAKFCAPGIHLIHSLDSERLAHELEKNAQSGGVLVKCLVQVNTSGETSKFGVAPENLESLVRAVSTQCKQVSICGLMTIGPMTDDQGRVRQSLKLLKQLQVNMRQKFSQYDWKYLSMGMSSDFEIAIEEGANLLRIGTAVFGERAK